MSQPERLDPAAIAVALADLNVGATTPWQIEGKRLHKAFRFRDFNAAFGFMTRVALLAETANHHPDWCNSYRDVQVNLTTHSAGGLTALDFALAARIEAVAS